MDPEDWISDSEMSGTLPERNPADQAELDKLKAKDEFREETQQAFNQYQLTMLSEESSWQDLLAASSKAHLAFEVAAGKYHTKMALLKK